MVRTTIMADEDTLYRIGRIAQRKGKSKAAIIREALLEYIIIEEEQEEPIENPLLGLIGLADRFDDQEQNYRPIDWEGKEHKRLYADYLVGKYERAVADFEQRQQEQTNESTS